MLHTEVGWSERKSFSLGPEVRENCVQEGGGGGGATEVPSVILRREEGVCTCVCVCM